MTSEWLKANMGGWPRRTPRAGQEAEIPQKPAPVTARVVQDADSREDGTGVWLPAAVISKHDEINVGGEWLPVADARITVPEYDRPGSAILDVPGSTLRLDYTAYVYARDAAAVIGGEIGGGR